jgi:hypothetical protein
MEDTREWAMNYIYAWLNGYKRTNPITGRTLQRHTKQWKKCNEKYICYCVKYDINPETGKYNKHLYLYYFTTEFRLKLHPCNHLCEMSSYCCICSDNRSKQNNMVSDIKYVDGRGDKRVTVRHNKFYCRSCQGEKNYYAICRRFNILNKEYMSIVSMLLLRFPSVITRHIINIFVLRLIE